MQNLKAGHAGTASSGLNHNGLSQNGYGEGKFLSFRTGEELPRPEAKR